MRSASERRQGWPWVCGALAVLAGCGSEGQYGARLDAGTSAHDAGAPVDAGEPPIDEGEPVDAGSVPEVDVPMVVDVPEAVDVPPARDVPVAVDTGVPARPDPLDAAPRCTSNLTWFFGNSLGDAMNPGEACIACHSRMHRGPAFQIAGTVYPSGHEPVQCIPPINSAAGATVEITDARGVVTRITPNLIGNFHWQGSLALPYTARVVMADGRERRMSDPQMNGDCNSCHTPSGTMDAPGRITLPP